MPEDRSRCTTLCSYPCAKDHRTKREKIEAKLAPGSGATEGERQNARALLASMKPAPTPLPRSRPAIDGDAIGRETMRRESDAASRRAREEQLRQAREALRRMSTDDLGDFFRRFTGQYSTSSGTFSSNSTNFNWRPPAGHKYDAPFPPGAPPDPAFCKINGHDWIVIAQGMLHTEIKRCTICGEYDPPRRNASGP